MKDYPPPIATYVGLALSLGWPLLILPFRKHGTTLTPSRARAAMTFQWGVTLILLWILWFWEGQSLASIGIRPITVQDVLWGVSGFFLGVPVFPLSARVIRSMGLGTVGGGITRLARLPIHIRIAMVFTAAITEEILFRGYPIERLASLTGHLWLGAAVAYGVFVLVHLPWWGAGGTIQIGLWSVVITALYVTTRSLSACMLMHVLNDAYAFLVLPRFFPQYLKS